MQNPFRDNPIWNTGKFIFFFKKKSLLKNTLCAIRTTYERTSIMKKWKSNQVKIMFLFDFEKYSHTNKIGTVTCKNIVDKLVPVQ